MKMPPIEKLARDLCYDTFASRKGVSATKAAYWKSLSPEKRTEYINEASYFAYTVKRIGRDWLNAIILGDLE